MAKSKRVQILQALVSTIRDNVPSIKTVHDKQSIASQREVSPLPAIYIESEDENRHPNPEIGSEEWLWDIEATLWANEGGDMEAMLKEVHDAVGENRTLGGLVHWIVRTSASPEFILTTDRSQRAIKMNFEVNYSHDLGVM